jgi:GNAT superfamily N-acetyltransferase
MARIRPAKPVEARAISALALRSKAHWGYTTEQLEVFRDELTLDAEAVPRHRTHVVEESGRVLGFYTLVPHPDRPGDDATVELEHLFVEPDVLGRGLGAALLAHACGVARSDGFARLVIQSDPNAAGFYDAQGARRVREIPSSIPGRTIPFYELDLGPARARTEAAS